MAVVVAAPVEETPSPAARARVRHAEVEPLPQAGGMARRIGEIVKAPQRCAVVVAEAGRAAVLRSTPREGTRPAGARVRHLAVAGRSAPSLVRPQAALRQEKSPGRHAGVASGI